jgi:hypothetical protein
LREYGRFRRYGLAFPDFVPSLTSGRRLALSVIIIFVLFISVGASFRMPVSETFLLIPAIINAGMFLSMQDLPWRLSWREERLLQDEETQNALHDYQTRPIGYLAHQ